MPKEKRQKSKPENTLELDLTKFTKSDLVKIIELAHSHNWTINQTFVHILEKELLEHK
jgi:hypothetical protein